MLIIGEKLNSAIPSVREFFNKKDVKAIQDLAIRQEKAGAQYLDLNTAQCDEVPDMEWLVHTVQKVTEVPLCLDSTSGEVIRAGLEAIRGDKSKVMINSISLEKNRIEGFLPLILKYGCRLIGLTVDDNGVPKTAEERINLSKRLIQVLRENNFDLTHLYIDPLVLPVAVNQTNAVMFFDCLREIKRSFNVKTVSGLSNISYELPKRKIINRHFLTMCIANDMDAAILDPLDQKIMTSVITVELLMGKDRFGKNFLASFRQGRLED